MLVDLGLGAIGSYVESAALLQKFMGLPGGAVVEGEDWEMRRLGAAVAGGLVWLALAALPANAGSSYGTRIEQLPEGVGCYWYRGQQYCNRYCYWEIDGYRYCQRRLDEATSQAPPVLLYDFEPRRYDRIRRGPVVLDDGSPRPSGRPGTQPIK